MKKPYHHGNLRESILSMTLQMLQENEGHLIGLREVARRLGVSRTAPYRHFESVDHMLAAVVEEGFVKLHDVLKDVDKDSSLEAPERFIALGIAYVHFALDHAAYYQLMFEPRFFVKGQFPRIQSLSSQCFRLLRETAAQCNAGAASEEERTDIANLAWAAVHGMARLFIDGQWKQLKHQNEFIQRSCERLIHALQDPPSLKA